jgi:hypothetical protein
VVDVQLRAALAKGSGLMPEHGPFQTEREASATDAVRAVYAAFDADPGAGKMAPHNLAMLTAACEAAGVELGAFDAGTLRGLAGWEPHTCAVIAGLIRRAYLAGQPAESDRLGFVVVTFNQASGQPELDYPDLHAGITDAMCERDGKREETATTGRGERHVIAEVIEMEGNDD